VITVDSGDVVTFSCLDGSNSQITPSSTPESVLNFDFSQLDQVNGPVYVKSASPGDVLQVEVLDIECGDWGFTAIIPGFGLLADEFPEPQLKIWSELDMKKGYAWFDEAKGIKIPLRPFPGELGVAPGEKGAFSTIPPYKTGGNLDTKWLGKGTKVFLPVQVEGALLSVGDGHAAQGDGGRCLAFQKFSHQAHVH
jgi:acetamidase/formamidase